MDVTYLREIPILAPAGRHICSTIIRDVDRVPIGTACLLKYKYAAPMGIRVKLKDEDMNIVNKFKESSRSNAPASFPL